MLVTNIRKTGDDGDDGDFNQKALIALKIIVNYSKEKKQENM